VNQLSEQQRELVSSLAAQLAAIDGVSAVVLGGSHARGRAQAASDIDLGMFYSEARPFSTQRLRQLAEEINDTPGPVVTDFYEWGPWVNGGAWLTIGGQRVDFLYRSLEHVERVITDAEAGRYEVHYLQQPPFGFFSGTYLGEVAVCIRLFDPDARIEALKRRVAVYPDLLRQKVIRDYLFMAEFTLTVFSPKVAARSDTYGTAACLTRAVNELVLALFALNRKYPINDKTVLAEVAEFEIAPRNFRERVQQTLSTLGTTAGALAAAVESIMHLLQETLVLANGLYQSRYALPK
jgi:predicted nucleotidyltransferase